MNQQEFKKKLNILVSNTNNFVDHYKEQFKVSPDMMYLLIAFERVFEKITTDIVIGRIKTVDVIHDNIFEFDHTIHIWREQLPHNIPTESNSSNDVYSVLFASLQALESLLAEYIENSIEE